VNVVALLEETIANGRTSSPLAHNPTSHDRSEHHQRRSLPPAQPLGRKTKQPGRPGNGQWLIDPKSIAEEKRRAAKRVRAPKSSQG